MKTKTTKTTKTTTPKKVPAAAAPAKARDAKGRSKKAAVEEAPVRPAIELHPNEHGFEVLRAELTERARKRPATQRLPFEEAVDASLILADLLGRHVEQLRAVDAGAPGTYDAFVKLTMAARALRFTHMQVANALASEGYAKLPKPMVEEGTVLRERMTKVTTYHLSEHPVASGLLAALIGGLAHKAQAYDLELLASLFEDYAHLLKDDRTHYDPADAPRARALSAEMLDLLGRPAGRTIAEWTELRAAALSMVVEYYDWCTRALALIEHDRPLDEFPSITTAIRTLRGPGRGTKRGADDDVSDEVSERDDAPNGDSSGTPVRPAPTNGDTTAPRDSRPPAPIAEPVDADDDDVTPS